VFVPAAAAATLPPTGTPSQLLAVEVFIDGAGYYRTNVSNFMKNFVKLSVIPGNLTLDQYAGFKTLTLCPSSQTNPPCSSLRAVVTKLPVKGFLFQPLVVAGALSDKRGVPISSVGAVVALSASAIVVQYQPLDVGVKPIAGGVWDTVE
jgi:hypothetical protein